MYFIYGTARVVCMQEFHIDRRRLAPLDPYTYTHELWNFVVLDEARVKTLLDIQLIYFKF